MIIPSMIGKALRSLRRLWWKNALLIYQSFDCYHRSSTRADVTEHDDDGLRCLCLASIFGLCCNVAPYEMRWFVCAFPKLMCLVHNSLSRHQGKEEHNGPILGVEALHQLCVDLTPENSEPDVTVQYLTSLSTSASRSSSSSS
jgi:hypothetical protein